MSKLPSPKELHSMKLDIGGQKGVDVRFSEEEGRVMVYPRDRKHLEMLKDRIHSDLVGDAIAASMHIERRKVSVAVAGPRNVPTKGGGMGQGFYPELYD